MLKRRKAIACLLALAGLVALAQMAEAQRQRGRRKGDFRVPDKIKVGDTAPDFRLKSLDGKQTVELSSFKGDKPVVLIFGSYT